MARVTIARQWGDDGDALQVTIEVAASYPDVLDQAKATALTAYAEALGVTLTAEIGEGDLT